MVVSGRLHSSRSTTLSTMVSSLVSLLTSFILVAMGTISSANRPCSWAAAMRCWDWSEYSSWYSRLTA